ncbi:MAG: hypothetical protein ABH817_00230 [archaeon]
MKLEVQTNTNFPEGPFKLEICTERLFGNGLEGTYQSIAELRKVLSGYNEHFYIRNESASGLFNISISFMQDTYLQVGHIVPLGEENG